MPKIEINYDSNHGPDDTFKKIKSFFSDGSEMQKIDSKIQCTYDDSKMTGKAKGGQFSADFSVVPRESGAKVSIIVDLPFLLTPLKGKIQEMISKKLVRHLG